MLVLDMVERPLYEYKRQSFGLGTANESLTPRILVIMLETPNMHCHMAWTKGCSDLRYHCTVTAPISS
jgi:hypothetical protein